MADTKRILMFALLLGTAAGRSWMEIIDSAIYLTSSIDIGRLEAIEKDPFRNETASTVPPNESNETPTQAPDPAASNPTAAPTARYEFIAGNGGCKTGLELFEIRMVDSWGDGWDSALLRIVETPVQSSSVETGETGQFISFASHTQSTDGDTTTLAEAVTLYEESKPSELYRGRLEEGGEGYDYVCLDPHLCYQVELDGGAWMSEIKWEIRHVELGIPREERDAGLAAAKGLAPIQCQFSIPDSETNELPCLVTCMFSLSPSNAPTAVQQPSDFPTMVPSDLPTVSIQSEAPTKQVKGSEEKSPMPSDRPSLVPSASDVDNNE